MNLFYIPSYVDREAKRKFKSYNCLIYPIISISIAYKCQILSFRREEITIQVHALALCYDDSHIQIKFMIESKAFILIKWCIQWCCHRCKGTMFSDSLSRSMMRAFIVWTQFLWLFISGEHVHIMFYRYEYEGFHRVDGFP